MNAAEIAAKLTKAQREALLAAAVPKQGRLMSDCWRKATGGRWQLEAVQPALIETRFSRGETLWRPTPLGLAVRAILQAKEPTDG